MHLSQNLHIVYVHFLVLKKNIAKKAVPLLSSNAAPKPTPPHIVAANSLIRETLEFGLRGAVGFVHEVLVLSLHQEMLRRHQGLVLDNCKNKHRHKYKSTWIIALAMNRRRRIVLVFMALSIGCYCHFITFSWKITALWNVADHFDFKQDNKQFSWGLRSNYNLRTKSSFSALSSNLIKILVI